MAKAAPPFEHVVYNGKLMDQKTKAFVQALEAELGYPLTIVQGCYNAGGVSASAGTHDAGGVIDLSPWDAAAKVRAARKLGACAWHRMPIPGVWGEHVHFVIRSQGNLSAAAAEQQRYFDEKPRRNGLAGEPVDSDQYPPTWPAPTFHYPPAQEIKPVTPTNVQTARDEISSAIASLSKAAALLDDTDKSRVVAHAQIDDLKVAEHQLRTVMTVLPAK